MKGTEEMIGTSKIEDLVSGEEMNMEYTRPRSRRGD